jgi:hypothetical protein
MPTSRAIFQLASSKRLESERRTAIGDLASHLILTR